MITPATHAATPPAALSGLLAGEQAEGGFETALAAALAPEVPGDAPAPDAAASGAGAVPIEPASVVATQEPVVPPTMLSLLDADDASPLPDADAEEVPDPSLAAAPLPEAGLAAPPPAAVQVELTAAPEGTADAAAPASALPASAAGVSDVAGMEGGEARGALRPATPGQPAPGSTIPPSGQALPTTPASPAPQAMAAARDEATADTPPALAERPGATAAPAATARQAVGPTAAAGADAPSPALPPNAPAARQGEASAAPRQAETRPERGLPPPAAAVAVQATGIRPVRPASPSLNGPVSPASIATLNAAASGPGLAAGPAGGVPASAPTPLAEATPAPAGAPEPAAPISEATAAPREPGRSIALGADHAASVDLAHAAEAAEGAAEIKPPPPQAPQTPTSQGTGPAQQGATGQTMQPLGLAGPVNAAAGPAQGQSIAQAPPPPRTVPMTPAQQVMPVLVTLAGAGGGAAVTVTLDPVELGRVEISVRRGDDQKAKVQVVAERPETLLLLLRDQPALDRALAQAGVGPEGRSISFDLAPGQQQAQGGHERGHERGGEDGRGAASRRDAAERETPTPDPQRRRLSLGALDIAV